MNACASASDLQSPTLRGWKVGPTAALAIALLAAAVLPGRASIPASQPAEQAALATAPTTPAGPAPTATSVPASPREVAEAWIQSQTAGDPAAYAAVLSPAFGVSTADGRIGTERWLSRRVPEIARRRGYTAVVHAIHPAGIHWPDDPDAVEVELRERWREGRRSYAGRARITVVDGAVVDEAHWDRTRLDEISSDFETRSPAPLAPSLLPKI